MINQIRFGHSGGAHDVVEVAEVVFKPTGEFTGAVVIFGTMAFCCGGAAVFS